MINLIYINDEGKEVKPLFHSGIVTGHEIINDGIGVPKTLVIYCQNNPANHKKGAVVNWTFTKDIERIMNWLTVINFLNSLKKTEPKKSTDIYKQSNLEL